MHAMRSANSSPAAAHSSHDARKNSVRSSNFAAAGPLKSGTTTTSISAMRRVYGSAALSAPVANPSMRYDESREHRGLPKRAFHPADPYYAFVWTLERSLPAGFHMRLTRVRRRLRSDSTRRAEAASRINELLRP